MKDPSGTNQELIEFCRGAYAGRELATPLKVILLDLKLPKVNGLEVLKAIKKVFDMVFRLYPAIRCIFFFLLLFALMLSGIRSSFAAEQIPVKRVHVMYGFNPNFPAHQLFTNGLQGVFGRSSDKFRIEYSFEYLDLGLGRADEEYRATFADFLKRKYSLKPKPDLIIAHLTPANTFLVKYAKEIMPGVPVVFTGDQPGMIPVKDIPSNFAGIVREGNPAPAVSLILQAQPETKKIYIVMGDSPHERETRLTFTKDLASFSEKVEIVYLNHLPFPQMMETIKGISGPSVILFVTYFQDVAKNNFVPAKVAEIISRAANVPTYGISAPYMGKGVVGGYQFSAGIVGERAAELGTKILLGRRISDFPREQAAVTAEYRFDWRALKRWGIDERRLPPESKFEYRAPTLWEAYKWYIVGGFILVLAETFLIFGLLINRRMREKVEKALRENEEKYRFHFENVSDVICSYDREFRILSISPSLERVLGYKPEEFIGKSFAELNIVSPEYFKKATSDAMRVFAGEHLDSIIYEFIARDGTRKYGEFSGTPLLRDGQVVAVVSVVRDITARKKAEDTLRVTQFSVDCAAESVAWIGRDGRYLYANDAFCRLLNYSRKEILSLGIFDLDPNISAENWPEYWRKIKQQEASVSESSRRTKDGIFIPVEVNANYLAYDDKEFIVNFTRDISQRKLSEERLKRQIDRLAALRAIDMAITASLDIRVTFSIFLEQVIDNLGVDAADVLVLNSQMYNRLSFVAGRGFRTDALRYTSLALGVGYAGRVARERKTIFIPDLEKEAQDFLKMSSFLRSENFITYCGTPLIAKGQVKGVLEIFNRTPLEPDQEWLDFLEALATQAAIAIDNAKLFDDLQKSNLDLIQAYDNSLEGWSRALDLRDKETEGHSQRVMEMTLQLAQQMGMRNSELTHVRRGALLHDIGKMGIPDGILLKPGQLNDEEWELMRKHPVYAYELLYPISHLRPTLDIPYCHHEKWDGTGYPRGLKGELIPLAARIFAIVDVWDALRSDRPYRPAWPEEKAREHIKEQTGKHFDPKVVEAFLELWRHP